MTSYPVRENVASSEKDLTIREYLGLSTNFDTSDYKVISAEKNIEHWKIRHSFAFDFKFSTYVIEPIIIYASSHSIFDINTKTEEIKCYIKKWLTKLPSDYFPKNRLWYSHDKELLDKEKIFIENKDPLFR